MVSIRLAATPSPYASGMTPWLFSHSWSPSGYRSGCVQIHRRGSESSHHHADHGGAASLFDGDVVRIGHEETKRLLLRDGDPARPVPEVTFADRYALQVGEDRVELAWHGPNHSPDNIYIHFPDHDTLMFIDVVNAGWVPIYNVNLPEDVPGYMAAPATALSYPWTHFICGHLGRLATRDDVAVPGSQVD